MQWNGMDRFLVGTGALHHTAPRQANDRALAHILHVFAITHVAEACQLMHIVGDAFSIRCREKNISILIFHSNGVHTWAGLICLISRIFIIKIVL